MIFESYEETKELTKKDDVMTQPRCPIHGAVVDACDYCEAKTDKEPFDLTQIPFEFERRLGMIFKEGETKYSRDNWRKGVGNKAFQLERANHALKHLKIYIHWLEFGEYLGEIGEDDLAKVGWFCATQAEIERLGAEANG